VERLVNRILLGESLQVLPTLADEAFQMIYIDPPFNTGKKQTRRTLTTEADETGDRVGFGGRRYASRLLAESSYLDEFADYLAFLEPRLVEGRRVLATTGTLYFHIDYREAHYCKLLLDEVFGRENFLNEIIWAYDYGARSKKRWPAKHDTILVYAEDAERYHFDFGRGRPRAVHGPRPRGAGEGGARQAPDRRLVAHDRTDQWPREDRLPDAEAGGHRAAHGRRIHPSR
jgi:site-specific DNA-methyltransferase (adenine-specific)